MRFLLPCLASFLLLPASGEQTAKSAAPARKAPLTADQGEAILNELRQIRILLQTQASRPQNDPPPTQQTLLPAIEPGQTVRVTLGTDRVLGKPDAPVTIVEFADYQCSFCKLFHTSTFPDLKRDYIDTGRVRFASRDLPLDMHEDAASAAEAARCAGEQGKFWEMREALIANAPALKASDVNTYALQLRINVPDFRSCLDTRQFKKLVQTDAAAAERLSISATPSFIIGRTTPDGVEGTIQIGAIGAEKLHEEIEKVEAKK